MPFSITWNNYVVSVLECVYMIYGTYWFTDVEPTCESRILLPQLPHTKMTCMHHDMCAPPHSFCLTQLLKRESQVWCAVKPHHDRVLGLGQRLEVYCDAMGRQEKIYFSFLSSHFFCSFYPWYPSFSFLLILLLLFHKRLCFYGCTCVCLDEYLLRVFWYLRDQKGTLVCSWSHRLLWTTPHGYRELDWGSLEAQRMLWTTEPLFQPLYFVCTCMQ